MDNFVDIIVKFLSVAFHSVIYYTTVYPQNVSDSRKKFNIVVYRSIQPEVNEYIEMCLKQIAECLKNDQISCIELPLLDKDKKCVIKFVFKFEKNGSFDETADAYLIQLEQNLRAFCLKLATMSNHFKDLPEEATSFTIGIRIRTKTHESTAINLVTNPIFDVFSLIDGEENREETEKIIPLKRFTVRSHIIDTFMELK